MKMTPQIENRCFNTLHFRIGWLKSQKKWNKSKKKFSSLASSLFPRWFGNQCAEPQIGKSGHKSYTTYLILIRILRTYIWMNIKKKIKWFWTFTPKIFFCNAAWRHILTNSFEKDVQRFSILVKYGAIFTVVFKRKWPRIIWKLQLNIIRMRKWLYLGKRH